VQGLCGDDDVPGWIRVQFCAQISGAQNRPDVSFDSLAAQHFGGVDSGDAETDVTDVSVCGKIFISKYNAH
jgi:hypothetical protein